MSTNIALWWVHWKINQSTRRFHSGKIHRTDSGSLVTQPRLQQSDWELLPVQRRLQQRNQQGSIHEAPDTRPGRPDKVMMVVGFVCVHPCFVCPSWSHSEHRTPVLKSLQATSLESSLEECSQEILHLKYLCNHVALYKSLPPTFTA